MSSLVRPPRPPRTPSRHAHDGGFTLIELTVSLAAGLIVALGIVGLSRDATHTFHEEMRSSAAEANLRTAVDRLRADLARAGYMSTGNVATDPMIARAPALQGQNPIPLAFAAGLGRLASIYLNQGGSAADTPLSAKQAAPVSPDIIELGGNMTSTDQYVVSVIEPSGGSCGGQRILLDPQSPSMFRILGSSADPVDELSHIFQPTAAGVAGQFMMRLVDKTGHSQFVAVCPGAPTGIVGGLQPYVDVDPLTPIQMASATGTVGGLNGYGSGSLVNPVQIVHWEVMPATAEPAQYQQSPLGGQPLTPTVVDPTKYDLVREYVDAKTGQVIPGTLEIVAEYAVDLDFAFSVDTGVNDLQPNIVTFPFDNTTNALWAPSVVVPPAAGIGPQRIRSVRVRLATRTAEPDRTLNVLVPNPTGPFMYRYCLIANGCDPVNATGVLQYARARTVTAEVSLPNQSRNYL
jgi:prepilin-type N-terminal cleavage/methylation domain-containing protein